MPSELVRAAEVRVGDWLVLPQALTGHRHTRRAYVFDIWTVPGGVVCLRLATNDRLFRRVLFTPGPDQQYQPDALLEVIRT